MKDSIPLTVGSKAPGASLPNPQIALDQGDSHGLCPWGSARLLITPDTACSLGHWGSGG